LYQYTHIVFSWFLCCPHPNPGPASRSTSQSRFLHGLEHPRG
jgi:hypothetical protein